jgi:hypothetical protein
MTASSTVLAAQLPKLIIISTTRKFDPFSNTYYTYVLLRYPIDASFSTTRSPIAAINVSLMRLKTVPLCFTLSVLNGRHKNLRAFGSGLGLGCTWKPDSTDDNYRVINSLDTGPTSTKVMGTHITAFSVLFHGLLCMYNVTFPMKS